MKASFLKRLSALLLAVLMMLSLLTFAFAEGEGEDGELPPTEEQEIIPLNEGTDVECTHVAGEATVVVAATCTEAGSSTATCVLCGEVLTVEIPATGHSHGEGVVTTKATCTEAGEMTFSCACGDSYTETIPAGHSYGEATVVNATCTKAGSSTATCTVCGELLTVEIPATGHSYTENVTKAANCTEAGQKTLSCACGDVQTVEIPAAHTPGEPVVVAATCTTDGNSTIYCSVESCGALISTETIPAGHTYENGVCTACGEAEPVPCSYRPDCAAEEHTAECIKGNVDKATVLFDALVNELALTGTITDEVEESVYLQMYGICELEANYRAAWAANPEYQMSVWNVIVDKLNLLVNGLPAADSITGENFDSVKAQYDKLMLLQEAYRQYWYRQDREPDFYNLLMANANFSAISEVIARGAPVTETGVDVAQVEGTKYGTLKDAIAAAAAINGTVTLLDSITIDSETYTIADGVSITLNMADKTITVTDNKTGNYELFYIYGTLNVTGSGTITLEATHDRDWNASSSIFHNRGGILTIDNGTFTHNGGTDMAYVIDNSGNWYGDATTNISGGAFSSSYIAIRNRMEQNSHGASGTAILNVNGGSISGTSRAIWAQAASTSETSPATGVINISGGSVGLIDTARSSGAMCMTTISGGTVAAFKGESGELTVTGGTISGTVTIMTASGEETQFAVTSDGKYVTAVAKLGETNYATLQEAVNAAKPGETVTLLHNSDETVELPTGVTLDKGNFTADNVTVAPSPVAQVGETPYTSLQDAIDNANGKTVTLLDDIALSEGVTIPAGSTVTLELNGKTISRNTEAAASSAAITNNGTLTVKDSLGGGKITAFAANPDTADIPYYASNTITNCGVFTLISGTIENSTGDDARAAYPIDNNSTSRDAIVYIQGGTVTGRGAIRQFANSTTNKNEVYITDGTVTGTSYGIWAQNPGSGDPVAKLSISEDANVAKVLLHPSANFDISISGGTISEVAIWEADANNLDRNPSGFITGGSFDSVDAIEEGMLAKGYTLVDNGSGRYSPQLTDPEAKIGDTPYATLAEAVAAANNAESPVIITVQKDVILDAPLNITGTVTLNMNGKTISQEKACDSHYGMINNSGSLAITGNGRISFKDTGAGDSAFGWGSYTIVNRGNLVVENGTIENLSQQNTPGNIVHMYCAIQQSSGTTTINDGSIVNNTYRSVRINSGHLLINGGNFTGQVWLQPNQGNASIEVNNGTFAPSGGDGSSIFLTNEGENYGVSSAAIKGGTFNTKIGATNATALGGIITGGNFTEAAKNGTNTALLSTGYSFVENGNGTYSPVSSNDASINGTLYDTLASAVSAASDGDTIKLLRNVELSGELAINKTLTIDPNGFTLDVSGVTKITVADGKVLTINLDFDTYGADYKALAPGLCVTQGSIKIQNHIEGTPATCTSGAICTTCAQPMGDPIPHSYTYTGSGDTITETCSNRCTHSETAKLERDSAVSTVYTGKKIEALKVVYSDNWKAAKDLAITYSDNEDIGKNATGTITKTFDTDKTATATATFEITRAAYTMTPNNLRYVRGSGYPLSFTTNVPYNAANTLNALTIYRANGTLVMNVPVNQVAVSANSNGMTVITIPGIVMNALEALNYELVAEFATGDARTPFRVLLPFIFPMTGDDANTIMLLTISLVALGGAAAIVITMRKKQRRGRHSR